MTTPPDLTLALPPSGPRSGSLAPMGPVVREFFRLLDAGNIPWAVLRGSDGLPDETRYDIDLLVHRAKVDTAETLLGQAARTHGWAVAHIIDKLDYRCCLLIGPGPQPRFLPVDFFGRCLHRFHPIADEAYALANRQRKGSCLWVVPPGFGAALALVKELMRHDTFKANSREEVMRGSLSDPEGFLNAVRPNLGAAISQRLLETTQSGDWQNVEKLAPDIRSAIHGQRFRRLPAAIVFIAKNLLHNLRPPMSALVVILGPDGAGKSTIGDLVAQRLYQRPFKVCRRFEYCFRILPELKHFKAAIARLFGRKVTLKAPPTPGTKGSGMNRDHSPLRAMLYILYYSLDLIVGRLLLRRLRGQGSLVLFARYFHDYYYQRGYGRAPRWFLRLVEYAVPAPDLIFYLHRDAAEIYAGKPELDLQEIQRQQAIIQSLAENRANATVIDASGGVERTVQRVCDAIIHHMLGELSVPQRGDEMTE